MEPRGAATLELENKFYLVSTQPREVGALFPVGQSKGQAAKGSFQVETVLGFVCRRHMLSPGSGLALNFLDRHKQNIQLPLVFG